jgi:hypothetical protein
LLATEKLSSSKFFGSKVPLFLPVFANYAILFSTLIIIALVPRNSALPLELANTPKNFPLGSLTAVFAPDTQVFLDYSSSLSWYLLTLVNFAVYLGLFFLLNWNVKRSERGIRCTFYAIVFLVLPVIANMLNLLVIGQSTLGPSGAYYSSDGLLVGFAVVNLWAGDAQGGWRKMTKRLDATLFVLNGAVATGFLMLSFADPVDFFSEVVSGYNVGYGIHIFCFYAAVVLAVLFSYSRRASLVNRALYADEPED